MTEPSPAERKQQLRIEAFARRDALEREWRREAAQAIAAHALAAPELSEARPVGGYWPIRSEVDPRPLMEALLAREQSVALSQIRHPHLSWREWRPGDVLIHGGFGVSEPGPDAPEVFPQALLVPLAAFDRGGGRLGYGKGHFDRSLAELSAHHSVLAIGLAYAAQEIEEVPREPHDRLLDLIVTEAGLIRPRREP